MDIEQILSATQTGENSDWEFKSARGGIPASLWETYSAMANTDGGVILLGVENDGRISGITNPVKIQTEFWSTINNRGRVSQNLLTNEDINMYRIEGRDVLAIQIPRATRRQRPIFLNQNPLTGTYRRHYEGDYRCSEDEVGRMLADKSEQSADGEILDGFDMNDLDPVSLAQYRNRFTARTPNHPWLSEDTQGLLIKLGGWRIDRHSGKHGLTVAGLLMFGRDQAIRDPAGVPQYHVDFREKLSNDSHIRWTDRLTIDGMWEANLFQFYQRASLRLTADIKIPFQLGPDMYRKDDTIVHEAIREALVNALIHTDYRGQGGIVIERYPHHIELSNPGSLLVSIEQMLQGGISECRNKSIQLMFQMIGGGEKAGSGMDKIRQGWASQKWQRPVVQTQMKPDRVKLVLPMISLFPEESITRLQNMLGSHFAHLNAEQVQTLVTADMEGSVTNSRLQQFSEQHTTDITKMLNFLVEDKYLVKYGYGRWASYRLNPEKFLPIEQPHDSPHHRRNFPKIDGSSPDIGGSSPDIGGSSPDIGGSSPDMGQYWERESVLQDPELLKITATSRKKSRLKPEVTERIILSLCQDRFLTFREIGTLLGRVPRDTRDRFLSPMVARGLLRLKYPNDIHHPDQAYTTQPSTPEKKQG